MRELPNRWESIKNAVRTTISDRFIPPITETEIIYLTAALHMARDSEHMQIVEKFFAQHKERNMRAMAEHARKRERQKLKWWQKLFR